MSDKDDKHRQIEYMLIQHPYLLNINFPVSSFVVDIPSFSDGTTPDAMVCCNDTYYVVELKTGDLRNKDVTQLAGYIDNLIDELRQDNVKGILVGLQPMDDKRLKGYIERKGYDIELKYVGIDLPIPGRYNMCEKGRHPLLPGKKTCSFCSSSTP
ncbi:MAG: hypothetical protein HQL06_05710 [Nitrospirae bacterium]|nr:hypothetical protein [Nitrospirota bacterium]